MQMCLAVIGASVRASLRYAQTVGSMVFAASVGKDTEPKTTNRALLSSRLATERELQESQGNVVTFLEDGPRSLSSSS